MIHGVPRAMFIGFALAANAMAQQSDLVRARPTKAAGIARDWKASGTQGAVAAGGTESVDAGIEIFKAGGNAADAAAATILAETVTDAHLFCFGGEVPIMVFDANEKAIRVIAGQGAAPRLATREHFAAKPGGIPERGIEPAAVPAALDAIVKLLDLFGTKSFAHVTEPTLRILRRNEQPWHADYARTLGILIDAEKKSLDSNQGRKAALASVADAFYRGPIARRIDAWSRENGGLLRYEDLEKHVTRIEDPVTVDYRGYKVAKCGPWTQGPALLQTLQLLEGFDLKALGANQPESIHLTIESLKLAFADRDVYYADPLFCDVPLPALLDASYAEKRRRLIDATHASLEQRPGDPRHGGAILDSTAARQGLGGPSHDTTTCLVADKLGNVVAATPSGWSGALAGDTGIWLGSRLQSFNTWDGHPNVIKPGKRPRITLTPTIVLKDGKPRFAVSVAGGDQQDVVTLQLLLDVIDYGMSPADAVTTPTFSTDHFTGSFRQTPAKLGSLTLSRNIDAKTADALAAKGHKITITRGGAAAAPIILRIGDGNIDAAGDPKAGRHAAAF